MQAGKTSEPLEGMREGVGGQLRASRKEPLATRECRSCFPKDLRWSYARQTGWGAPGARLARSCMRVRRLYGQRRLYGGRRRRGCCEMSRGLPGGRDLSDLYFLRSDDRGRAALPGGAARRERRALLVGFAHHAGHVRTGLG